MATRDRCTWAVSVQNGAELGAPGDDCNKSPCSAGKGDPDCSKTKHTVRLHPREYFPAFLSIAVRMRDWFLKNGFPRV